jgi:hypothetical protein
MHLGSSHHHSVTQISVKRKQATPSYFWVGGVAASIKNWALGGLTVAGAILDLKPLLS